MVHLRLAHDKKNTNAASMSCPRQFRKEWWPVYRGMQPLCIKLNVSDFNARHHILQARLK